MTQSFRTTFSWRLLLFLLAVGCISCDLSARYLDRPVATFFHTYPHGHSRHFFAQARRGVTIILEAMLLAIPVAVSAAIYNYLAKRNGVVLPKWVSILGLAGYSTIGSVAINDLVLKPIFGRLDLDSYFATPSHYGFLLFKGGLNSSFPSGQAVLVVSFLTVFWVFYPRRRTIMGTAIATILFSLIFARWHFVSDVVAGTLVGAVGGIVGVVLGQRSRII